MKRINTIFVVIMTLAGTHAAATGDYFGDLAAHKLNLTIECPVIDYNTIGQMIQKSMTGTISLTNGIPILSIPSEKYTCAGTVTIIMYSGLTKDNPKELRPHGKLVFNFKTSGWGDGVFMTQYFEIPFTADAKDKKAMLSIQTEGTYELRNESELTQSFKYTISPDPVPCHITVQESSLGVMNKLPKNR